MKSPFYVFLEHPNSLHPHLTTFLIGVCLPPESVNSVECRVDLSRRRVQAHS